MRIVINEFISLSAVAIIAMSMVAGTPTAASATVAGSLTDEAPVLNLLTEEAIRLAVEEHVRDRVEAAAAEQGERVEIRPRWQGDILFEDIPARPFDLKVSPLSSRPYRGPTLLRVEIRAGGAMLRALTVTVDARYYREVLVTSRTIRRGALLTPDMVELVERDVTSLKHGYLTVFEELGDLQASRPIGAGDIVSRNHVKPIPLVHRGDEIVMTVVSRHMQLAASGVALQDGGAGERIRVKSVDSGKIVYGRVDADGSVRIGL